MDVLTPHPEAPPARAVVQPAVAAFIEIWNESNSVPEVATRIGAGINATKLRASRLRKRGFQLKIMPFHHPRSVVDRLWEKVIKGEGCWLWTGAKSEKGYGNIFKKRGNGRTAVMVHRVSYEIHFGEIPEGLFVLHRCDVPACVNPSHLFLGTAQDNVDDMIAKGRGHWQ